MKITAKIEGLESTRRLLKQYAKVCDASIVEGIKVMGLSSARWLAHRVQPWGVDAGRGARFMRNLEAQVDQVYFGVNIGAYPATTDIREAHYAQRRNGKIRARRFTKDKGNPWKGIIKQDQLQAYKREVVAKAGRAKGAWIESGNSLGLTKLSGIAKWIDRHNATGYGGSRVREGSAAKASVELWNHTPYISKLQRPGEIKAALRLGRRNGIKRLEYIIKGALKKQAKMAKAEARKMVKQTKAAARHSKAATRMAKVDAQLAKRTAREISRAFRRKGKF